MATPSGGLSNRMSRPEWRSKVMAANCARVPDYFSEGGMVVQLVTLMAKHLPPLKRARRSGSPHSGWLLFELFVDWPFFTDRRTKCPTAACSSSEAPAPGDNMVADCSGRITYAAGPVPILH
jgi:hypothetical protein